MKKRHLEYTLILNFFACLVLNTHFLHAALDETASTPSMRVYQKDAEKLVVYTNIPGHQELLSSINPHIKSNIYKIRVRSTATNNEWVECFANYTYNRALELPQIPGNNGKHFGNIQGYSEFCPGWSNTYANIEMSENSTVEVEISKIGDTLLDGVAVIEKSAVHPSHKISNKRDEDGKVYFKLNKPCQVVIDINGQMDDHNAFYPDLAQIGPVHAVTFFANPVIAKPPTTGEGIRYVKAGTKPDSTPDYTTMVFGPGVHFINAGFKIYAQKSYYIPGDAILFGSLSNEGTPPNGLSNGDGITIYGYGTLNGFFTPHYFFDKNNPSYPDYNGGEPVGLRIKTCVNLTLNGIAIVDPANFNTFLEPMKNHENLRNEKSLVSWVKTMGWRSNGDGINGYFPITDSFFRTSDDSTSIYGDRIRCTFWKDTNGNLIRLRNWYPNVSYIVDDCDVIYNRRRPGRQWIRFPLTQR